MEGRKVGTMTSQPLNICRLTPPGARRSLKASVPTLRGSVRVSSLAHYLPSDVGLFRTADLQSRRINFSPSGIIGAKVAFETEMIQSTGWREISTTLRLS